MVPSRIHPAAAVVALLSSVACPIRAQDATDSLRLTDVLIEAETRNPGLGALRLSADAVALREPSFSTLPDPLLQVGIQNFGVPDLATDMAMSMAPSVQLTQTLPWPGKLGMSGDVSAAESGMAAAQVDEALWRLRARTAAVFYEIYALDRRITVGEETLELLRGFREVALAMYVTGSGTQADVLRADVEIARTRAEIRRMEGTRAAAAARLNGILDHPPGRPVATAALGAPPLELPEVGLLESWALEARPLLRSAELGTERAAAAAARAGREVWPDLRLGLGYGQRNRGFGTERMGSVMVGFTLPLFAGRRQFALRDAADAEARVADARLGEARAEVASTVRELVAHLDATRTLVGLYRDEVVPQARANVEAALASYRVGAVDFPALVDAQTTTHRYEAELYGLMAAYGATLSALESAVGRPMPTEGPALEEAGR